MNYNYSLPCRTDFLNNIFLSPFANLNDVAVKVKFHEH